MDMTEASKKKKFRQKRITAFLEEYYDGNLKFNDETPINS